MMEKIAGLMLAAFALLLLGGIFTAWLFPLVVIVAIGGLAVLAYFAYQHFERTSFASHRAHQAHPNSPPPPRTFDYVDHARYREDLQKPVAKEMMKASEASRMEHTLIVASSGHGKSQLLEWLIADDLRVTRPPCVIVIDSKGGQPDGLVKRLARVAKDPIIIDPRQSPALNLFDVPPEQHHAAVTQLSYFLGSLFEGEVSATMGVAFRPLVALMLHIQGANLDTLNDAIKDIGKFKNQIGTLPDKRMARFLLTEFAKIIGAETKNAVHRRILGMTMQSPAFDAMFNAKTNSLDLVEALDYGRTVLVNTDASFLADLSPSFGKYIISKVITAALNRKTRNAAYLFIDEAKPYTDEKTEELLTTLRSYNLGVTLAYQTFPNLAPSLRETILTNTTVKYVGGGDKTAANIFSHVFPNTTPEFIFEQGKDETDPPRFTRFALHIKNKMQTAQSVTLPLGHLDMLK